jgi:hypothetical protein
VQRRGGLNGFVLRLVAGRSFAGAVNATVALLGEYMQGLPFTPNVTVSAVLRSTVSAEVIPVAARTGGNVTVHFHLVSEATSRDGEVLRIRAWKVQNGTRVVFFGSRRVLVGGVGRPCNRTSADRQYIVCQLGRAGGMRFGPGGVDVWVRFVPLRTTVGLLGAALKFRAAGFSEVSVTPRIEVAGCAHAAARVAAAGRRAERRGCDSGRGGAEQRADGARRIDAGAARARDARRPGAAGAVEQLRA